MTSPNQAPYAGDPWEAHLAILRHLVHGRWDQLREISPGLDEADDSFCQMVIEQHLTYFVLGRLAACPHAALLPPRWIEQLRAETGRWQGARRLLKEKLANGCTALTRAGVEFRVLKGVPFAQRYYGDINIRRWADIDLLVHEQDVDRAIRVLWDLGYRDNPPCLRGDPGRPGVTRSMLRKEHELTLEHDRIQIDLHWRFRTAPGYRWNEAEIWASTSDVCVEGVSYPVLSDEYTLVLLLVSTAHDIARGGCRLKHLLDVHQLLRCEKVKLDWQRFFENRQEETTLGIVVNMLGIVLDVWDERGLDPLRAELEKHTDLRAPGAGSARSLALVRSPRGGVENKIWFAQVYGIHLGRDAGWILRRTLRHPRRWLLGFGSLLSYGSRWVGRLAGSRRGD